ncbi:EF-hand domain-containing protein [Allorhizobium sp. BGMRC 0089]|uniref:EF-hand domain-containing protein n=1 Tax=Allorhizobium sonneratiae TaxID=2934936 RepID=UPI002033F6E1|nr:EF-hand domain-containing protein [Allorhizobium sonneratiae]MCM2291546.1 EF-hand domain-containing protein [Allorhizobium sonneratiae]
MSARKTIVAALAATLLASASSGAVFAQERGGPDEHGPRPMMRACGPHMHRPPGPAELFIIALQQFDTNKDGKISLDEAKAAEDKIFAAIDTNKDGVLTPGELKAYHDTRMKALRDMMSKRSMADEKAAPADDPAAKEPPVGADETAKAPPPPPGDDARMGPMGGPMHGPMDAMDDCGPSPMGWGGPHGHHPPMPPHGPMHHGMMGERGEGPHGMRMMMEMMWPYEMLARFDTDQNGQISKAEADAALVKLFKRLDTNHDGYISADDFPKVPPLAP